MKYGSVCSGVEAATLAWHHLGWEPQWFSEIEKFPSDVLNYHYPNVPNLGDMTNYKEWSNEPIKLLVGGTPCQSFSVAGLRKGLDDPRGNLMLTYLGIADRYKPKWIVWENVPGVLSSNKGRDFGTFLGALVTLGYGFAYRVLDAQYFGVAQRRRRVFVVGYLGDWRRAAAVLFERESLSGPSAPSRKEREEVAKCLTSRVGQAYDAQTEQFVTKFVPAHEKVGTLTASMGTGGPAIDKPLVFGVQNSSKQGLSASTEVSPTPDTSKTPAVKQNMKVRRLTPIECERLQGFPDNFTQIPYRNKDAEQCPDSPRYKAIGNSMAVPVMRWIGERIDLVEKLTE